MVGQYSSNNTLIIDTSHKTLHFQFPLTQQATNDVWTKVLQTSESTAKELEYKTRRQSLILCEPIDELFLCLVRLRLGLQISDLAFRFSISPSLMQLYNVSLLLVRASLTTLSLGRRGS